MVQAVFRLGEVSLLGSGLGGGTAVLSVSHLGGGAQPVTHLGGVGVDGQSDTDPRLA